jgi:hypothetical protein
MSIGNIGSEICRRCGTKIEVDGYCENGHARPVIEYQPQRSIAEIAKEKGWEKNPDSVGQRMLPDPPQRSEQPQKCEHEWDVSTGGAHPVGTVICNLCGEHKPHQPQEWTPEMVAATLKDRPFAHSTLASAHNAALAAKQQYWQRIAEAHGCADLTDAFVQLAAEREKTKRLVEALEKARETIHVLLDTVMAFADNKRHDVF